MQAGLAGLLSVLRFECDVATYKNNLYENIFSNNLEIFVLSTSLP